MSSTLGGNTLHFFHGVLNGEAIVSILEFLRPLELGHTPADPPVEVFTARLPRQDVTNHTLCLHASSPIMQIGKFVCDVEVNRLQLFFTSGNLLLESLILRVSLELVAQRLKRGIQASHRLRLVSLTVLDLTDARRLQDTTPRFLVGVHFHVGRVDSRVDHHPRTTSELTVWWDVDEHRLLVRAQGIHDLRSKLENLTIHVSSASGETTPVGEDYQRQVLSPVEVFNGLGRLESRIREPYLTCLRLDRLPRFRVGRVCRDASVNKPGLHSDASDRDAAQLASSDNDRLAPASERLSEGPLIEESSLETLVCLDPGKHVPRVVRRFGRLELHGSRGRILGGNHGHDILVGLRHVRQPV
mmetsp:Transcript_21959/g.41126  ORF Transcript_21959/g.41126 Transcript_21959/m.41126 type:complete len:357 (-) Transcript_21959:181-1251(-)